MMNCRMLLPGVLLALALVLAEIMLYQHGRAAGRAEVQAKWAQQTQAAQRQIKEQTEAGQSIINHTLTHYVTQTAAARVVYRDIIREVPRYVPNDLPVLPASVRLLHDAAARGSELPDLGDTGGTDAATVSVETLAATVAENYAGCREDRERLVGLQRVVGGVLRR